MYRDRASACSKLLVASLLIALGGCGGGGGEADDGGNGRGPPPSPAAGRFTVIDNGGPDDVVRDNVTGRTWTRDAQIFTRVVGWETRWEGLTLTEAKNDLPQLVNAYQLGGFTDWRLPTIEELAEFWSAGAANSGGLFVNVQVDDYYWSSTYVEEKCLAGSCWNEYDSLLFAYGSPYAWPASWEQQVWLIR